MKKAILLLMILILPTVAAIGFDDLLSNNVTLDNNICDAGENPIHYPDECEFEVDFKFAWVWRFLLLGMLLVFAYKKLEGSRDMLMIAGVILIIFTFTAPSPIEQKEIVYINETVEEVKEFNIMDKTIPEKIIDWISTLGSKVSPSKPYIGWLFIIIFSWFIIGVLNAGENARDNYFYRKIRNIWRK